MATSNESVIAANIHLGYVKEANRIVIAIVVIVLDFLVLLTRIANSETAKVEIAGITSIPINPNADTNGTEVRLYKIRVFTTYQTGLFNGIRPSGFTSLNFWE
jgi:hypothetical protein